MRGNPWWTPLTGVLFVVLLFVSFAVAGEPPEAGEPVAEIVAHYTDNKDSILVGSLIGGIAALMLLFFAAILRKLLVAAAGPGSVMANLVLAGAVIIATGAMIDATIQFAIAEAAEDIDPVAVQALQALWDNDFLPIGLGIVTLLLSAGAGIVRTGVLPTWLGWFAIVLGVVGLTPVGWFAFLGGGAWVLITSVMLAVRGRAAPPAAPAAPATPAAV